MSRTARKQLASSPLGEVIRLIESRYHARQHDELPYIERLRELALLDGPAPEVLGEIGEVCDALRRRLEEHTGKEERLLFPLIRQLEVGGPARRPPVVTLGPSLAAMTREHELIERMLARVRSLAGGYDAGPEASEPLARLYRALQHFDEDLVEHMRIEDEILFPRALALEAAACGVRSGR